jgi:hypothetical protein
VKIAIFLDVHNSIYFGALRPERDTRFRCDGAEGSNSACSLVELDPQKSTDEFIEVTLNYGQLGETDINSPVRIGIEHPLRPLEQSPYTYAFAEETNTFAVLGAGGIVLLKDLMGSNDPVKVKIQQEEFPASVQDSTRALELLNLSTSWMRPLFAISRYNGGWILAWDAADGFWTASAQDNSNYATPMLNGTLMSGEPGGRVLKFANDGSELVLLQQPRWGGLITVRIGDLRTEWLDWVKGEQNGPNEKELVKLACGIIRGSGNTVRWHGLQQIYLSQNQTPPCE